MTFYWPLGASVPPPLPDKTGMTGPHESGTDAPSDRLLSEREQAYGTKSGYAAGPAPTSGGGNRERAPRSESSPNSASACSPESSLIATGRCQPHDTRPVAPTKATVVL